jgi:hypothetical protein
MTRKELQIRLNELLKTNYSWDRLNKLYLERLVASVERLKSDK